MYTTHNNRISLRSHLYTCTCSSSTCTKLFAPKSSLSLSLDSTEETSDWLSRSLDSIGETSDWISLLLDSIRKKLDWISRSSETNWIGSRVHSRKHRIGSVLIHIFSSRVLLQSSSTKSFLPLWIHPTRRSDVTQFYLPVANRIASVLTWACSTLVSPPFGSKIPSCNLYIRCDPLLSGFSEDLKT